MKGRINLASAARKASAEGASAERGVARGRGEKWVGERREGGESTSRKGTRK